MNKLIVVEECLAPYDCEIKTSKKGNTPVFTKEPEIHAHNANYANSGSIRGANIDDLNAFQPKPPINHQLQHNEDNTSYVQAPISKECRAPISNYQITPLPQLTKKPASPFTSASGTKRSLHPSPIQELHIEEMVDRLAQRLMPLIASFSAE